jgi:hypothetical protein
LPSQLVAISVGCHLSWLPSQLVAISVGCHLSWWLTDNYQPATSETWLSAFKASFLEN